MPNRLRPPPLNETTGNLQKHSPNSSLPTAPSGQPLTVDDSTAGDMANNKKDLPLMIEQPLARQPATPASSSAIKSANIPSSNPKEKKNTIKLPKPHSKTAIGRLAFSLDHYQPGLYKTDLKVEISDGNEDSKWIIVQSPKLIRRVVSKWLESDKLRGIRNLTSLDSKKNLGANAKTQEKTPIPEESYCQILVQVHDQSHAKEIEEKLQSAPVDVSGMKLKVHNGDGTIVSQNIRCGVAKGKYCSAKAQDIQRLLRDSDNTIRELSRYSVPAKLPECSAKQPATDFQTNDTHSEDASSKATFPLYTRIQPSIEASKSQLNLDFDLVPCVPVKAVDKVVFSLIGTTEPDSKLLTDNMYAVARTLRGMWVRCTYIPAGKTQEGHAQVQILSSDERHLGRRFRINDIAMLSGKDSFKIQLEGKTFEMPNQKYFQEIELTNKKTLNTGLPCVKDDTGAWIPVELLDIDSVQPLVSFDHQNNFVREKVQLLLKKGGIDLIQEHGKSLLANIKTIRLEDGTTAPWWDQTSTPIFSAAAAPGVDVKPKSSSPSRANINTHVGIVECFPTGESDLAQGLVNQLRSGLSRYDYSLLKDRRTTDGKSCSHLKVARADLLVAVIDDLEISNDETHEISARLHIQADTVLGIPLLCFTATGMQGLFSGRHDHGKYVPASIRAKINFVLGRQVFDHPQLAHLLGSEGVMIAGAHLSHPATNGRYSPSIAAVVATTDGSATQYAGTARLQGTTMQTKRKSDSRIEALTEMVREVCEKWRGAAPKELIFFRDGIDFDDPTVDNEYALVHRVAKGIFAEVDFTYIIVNKNTQLQYKKDETPDLNRAHPLDDYLAEGDSIGKYRYYIVGNSSGRNTAALAKLTSCLNESSQLTPQYEQTAKALPLLWAAKLADRMYSYFRFSNVLSEVKPVKRSDRNGGPDLYRRIAEEKRVVEDVKKHLGLKDENGRKVPWKPELDGTMFYL